MTMSTCRECGKPVNTESRTCHNCGAPAPAVSTGNRTRTQIIVGLVIAALVVGWYFYW